MNIIVPITIAETMIGAGCSLAEDPTTTWTSGTYAVGDLRHVVATHTVYECVLAGSSTVTPQDDPTRWLAKRPTNKWAPFDWYASTQATSTTTDIIYPITARFVNAVALYGIVGTEYEFIVKDQAGGTVIYSKSGKLKAHDRGWFSYLFGARRQITKLVFKSLPIHPAAEITIKIKAGAGLQRSLGTIVLGKYRNLAGRGSFGGTQYGATVEPVTYSYIKTEDDGTTVIKRRHSGTNLRGNIVLPRSQADAAISLLQQVLDVPVACIASDKPGYEALNTFGLISSSPVKYDGPLTASIDFNVKGII